MLQDKVFNFIQKETYAVLSSANRANQPESALVGFSQTKDMQLIVGTNAKTRKVQNILLNPNIAIVIGLGNEQNISVQLEGTAKIVLIKDGAELADIHYKKIPSAGRHKDSEDECFILFSPTWARYTNFGITPEEVIEDYFDVD